MSTPYPSAKTDIVRIAIIKVLHSREILMTNCEESGVITKSQYGVISSGPYVAHDTLLSVVTKLGFRDFNHIIAESQKLHDPYIAVKLSTALMVSIMRLRDATTRGEGSSPNFARTHGLSAEKVTEIEKGRAVLLKYLLPYLDAIKVQYSSLADDVYPGGIDALKASLNDQIKLSRTLQRAWLNHKKFSGDAKTPMVGER